MKKFSKIFIYVMLLATLGLTACDDSQDSSASGNIGGMLSRDGDQPIPLFITNSSVNVHDNTSATISLSNWWVTQGGMHSELILSIDLTIPLNQFGQEVTLDASNASMEEFPPCVDTAACMATPVTEVFQSVSATGTATVFHAFEAGPILNPDHASGVFHVVFTDADGHTREITNGFFNF